MQAVRIAISPKVEATLKPLRRRYPTLSDAEIFKVSLAEFKSAIVNDDRETPQSIAREAAWVMNQDGWLDDPAEDIYAPGDGKPLQW